MGKKFDSKFILFVEKTIGKKLTEREREELLIFCDNKYNAEYAKRKIKENKEKIDKINDILSYLWYKRDEGSIGGESIDALKGILDEIKKDSESMILILKDDVYFGRKDDVCKAKNYLKFHGIDFNGLYDAYERKIIEEYEALTEKEKLERELKSLLDTKRDREMEVEQLNRQFENGEITKRMLNCRVKVATLHNPTLNNNIDNVTRKLSELAIDKRKTLIKGELPKAMKDLKKEYLTPSMAWYGQLSD